MYNIIICDNNKEYIEYLKGMVIKTGIQETKVIFKEFLTGELLVEYLEDSDAKCDLLIIDAKLPKMSGDEAAEIFRQRFPNTLLVFCSGECKPTDRSFKVMAYRYLYKEYTDSKMLDEMNEIMNKMIIHKSEPTIVAHSYFKQIQLKLDDILYIQLARRGSKINVCPNVDLKDIEGDLLSNEKLSDLYEKLKDFGFAYAHNSYIVNLRYIKKILSDELVFVRWENEEKEKRLSISRAKLKELKEIFAKEMGNKY